MPLFKEDTKDYSRAMKNMLLELDNIKKTCLPDQKEVVDTKNMDKYDKKRLELMNAMTKLQEIMKNLAEQKSAVNKAEATIIKLKNDNRKQIRVIEELFNELKGIFQTFKKKHSKKQAEKVEDREKDIERLDAQISKMMGNPKSEEKSDVRVRSRTEQRRREREDKRKQRRGKKNKGSEIDEIRTYEPDEKEQIFLDEVKANREKEDEMLDEISKGLDELKNLSKDINNTLSYQAELLNQVDESLEEVTEKFETGNQKLNDLLEKQGGMSTWCPRITCIILLLAIIGYFAKLILA